MAVCIESLTPALGAIGEQAKIENIPAAIGEAQGLLWAFDCLYVMVNRGQKYPSGLYRVRSSKNDDVLDSVELLRKLDDGSGEHGPHAVILAPDGKSLYVLHGNKTGMTQLAGSWVPRVWGEDHILPRMPDGKGFIRGVLAPGGCIYKVDPDGKNWELISMGYRNQFDMAFNRQGDLFTYDADMEWDFNTPWYRPTRGLSRRQRNRLRLAKRSRQVSAVLHRHSAARCSRSAPVRRPVSRSATERSSRAKYPGRAAHVRLELRQALRRSPDAQRQRVHGRAGRVLSPVRRCR